MCMCLFCSTCTNVLYQKYDVVSFVLMLTMYPLIDKRTITLKHKITLPSRHESMADVALMNAQWMHHVQMQTLQYVYGNYKHAADLSQCGV